MHFKRSHAFLARELYMRACKFQLIGPGEEGDFRTKSPWKNNNATLKWGQNALLEQVLETTVK